MIHLSIVWRRLVLSAFVLALPLSVFAQSNATAIFTQWDIFVSTGADGTATQNVASIMRDPNGAAGPAGAVWFTGQNPEPRLGRLDPDAAANNYVEWRPFEGLDDTGGSPLGLTINQTNGDVWMAVQGLPSLVLKVGGTNTFRRFEQTSPLITQGIVVAPDQGLYVALPSLNAYNKGRAIIKVPRDLSSSAVNAVQWRFDLEPAGEPQYLALDSTGNIWFTDQLNNLIGRLNPATDVVTEWPLPVGTYPVGLQLSGSTACVVSDGLVPNAGVVQCLDSTLDRITHFVQTGTQMNRPQQLARNSFAELFVTEWSGNGVIFIGQDAYQAATTINVTRQTRTRPRTTMQLYARTLTDEPTTRTIVPTVSTLTGESLGNGQTRFKLPLPTLTYPFSMKGYPQPFGITAAYNDYERGSGTAFLAEYYNGPIGAYSAARIDKLEVIAPRTIDISLNALSFAMTLGGAAPGSQTIAVTERSGLSLDWTATASQSWVTVSPTSGTAPSSVVVAVSAGTLGVGTHTAVVTFDDGPGRADPKNVAITFTIQAQPAMALSASTLTYTAASGGSPTPATQTFSVQNTGGGTLDCTATASEAWVVLSEPSSCDFGVALQNPPASAGTYTATITVTSPGATNSPVTLTVSFTREAPVDTTAPVLTLPGALVVEATGPSGAVVTYTVTAQDETSGPVTPSCTPASGTTFALTTTTVTCTATDAKGNQATGTFTITVRDTTAPTVTVPANMTVDAAGEGGTTVSFAATATDLVSGTLTAVCVPASGSTFPIGGTIVTCTATDGAGQTGTASFSITVRNTASPVLNLPSAITTPLTSASGAVVTYSVTATDPAGGGAPTVVCSPASGSTFPVGTTTVTCTATSAGGAQTTGVFSVTVTPDVTAPVLTLPSNLTIEATGPSGATATYTVSASDAISGTVTPSCSVASGSTFPLATTTVNCTASDSAGNQATGSFTVTVRDTTGPTVTVPATISREATGSTGAAATFSASATDLVSGSLTPVCSPASGSVFALGTTSVTCTATDAAGNAGSKSFAVVVVDTTAPVLSLPASVTATSSTGGAVPVTFTATANDLVSGSVAVSCTPASGSAFNVGTTTVDCSASDAKGNTATGSFAVVVSAPSFQLGSSTMYFKTGRLAYCNGLPVGPNWKDQGLVVTNTGSAAITVAGVAGSAWIKVPAPVSIPAGASVTVTVSVDITAMGRGIYQGSFSMSGGGSVKPVPVTLEVGNALPTLCLTPKTMGWGQVKPGATSTNQVFDVVNVGDDPMANWAATRVATDGTINMSATKGAAPKTVTISVKAGRKRGTQSGTITITAPGAVQGTQNVDLAWTVQ